MILNIREMSEDDIGPAARVHEASFSRQDDSREWIACNFRAFPRIQMFVAVVGDEAVLVARPPFGGEPTRPPGGEPS